MQIPKTKKLYNIILQFHSLPSPVLYKADRFDMNIEEWRMREIDVTSHHFSLKLNHSPEHSRLYFFSSFHKMKAY